MPIDKDITEPVLGEVTGDSQHLHLAEGIALITEYRQKVNAIVKHKYLRNAGYIAVIGCTNHHLLPRHSMKLSASSRE